MVYPGDADHRAILQGMRAGFGWYIHLKSVYSIAMVSLEIPTGYLADVWGRRNCLIAGCIFCFLGFTNYSISDTFTAFFLSEILLGFGQSLVSGADSALLYDTMLHYKKEDEYLKYEGRVTMVGNFSEAFAGIFSGLLEFIPFGFLSMCKAGLLLSASRQP